MDIQERWREVCREAIHLCSVLENLPDECPCGDAEGHLEGRCPCCGEHERSAGDEGKSRNCSEILAGLRADVSMFYEDFRRVAAPELGRMKRYGTALRSHCEQIGADIRTGLAVPPRE